MFKYIVKRLLYVAFVFIIVSVIMFAIYKAVPGDPVRMMLEGQKKNLTPEQYDKLYEQTKSDLGLDKSVPVQYVIWFKNMMTGDFGYSIQYRMDVKNMVAAPMKNTITLNVVSLLLVFAITIPLGIATAVKKYSTFDNVVQVGTVVGYSLPSFVVSLVFIFLFAIKLPIFPISGVNSPGFSAGGFAKFLDTLHHMCLPVLVMTFSSLGGLTRYVRAAMIDVLKMDFIRTARAKGLKEKVVIYSHAFRNALIPIVTVLTGWFISIFSGSVVIESIFLWNGIGKVLYDALMQRDFMVVLAMQMFYVILALAANLVMDILYGFVDPRVKIEK